jgi:hypothetical protein
MRIAGSGCRPFSSSGCGGARRNVLSSIKHGTQPESLALKYCWFQASTNASSPRSRTNGGLHNCNNTFMALLGLRKTCDYPPTLITVAYTIVKCYEYRRYCAAHTCVWHLIRRCKTAITNVPWPRTPTDYLKCQHKPTRPHPKPVVPRGLGRGLRKKSCRTLDP